MVERCRAIRMIVVFVFGFCLVSCDVPAKREASQTKVGSTDQPPAFQDAWQRTKDCTEQADRLVKRNGWIKGQLAGGQYLSHEVEFMQFESHYSPKYQRCYLRAKFYTSLAPDNPIEFYHLYDAYEGRLLAICNGGGINFLASTRAKLFCSIEEKVVFDIAGPERHSGDCEICRAFVAERWNN